MNQLLKLKTQRITSLALLEEGNVLEAIKIFEKYQNNLKKYVDNEKNIQDVILKEIIDSKNIFIEKLNNLSKDYIEQKNYNKASICLAELIYHDSKDYYNIINYIICLYKLGQYDLQNKYQTYLLKILPENDYSIYKKLALLYSKVCCHQEAIKYQEKYLSICPKDELTEYDYALMGQYCNDSYHQTFDLSFCYKAIEYLKLGEKINNKNSNILRFLLGMAVITNDNNLALEYINKIFEYCDITNEDKFNYSIINFKKKNFKEFYKYYDSRFKREKKDNRIFFPKINKPQWKGEDISEKTLLVHCEQGFGDTVLMWGYAQRLSKLAKKVIYMVQPELYCIFNNNEWGVEVLPGTVPIDSVDFDFYIPTMSIPAALNLDESNISVGGGYIKADKDLSEEFKQQFFNNDKLKIGISFSGKLLKDSLINHRNIPIKEFLPLDTLDNVELYSLTKDLSDEDFKDFQKNKVHNLSNYLLSFAHTVALMDNCDLVVSSDNCLLNLAGAMGKKTYGIFNWYYEYRWYDLTGEDVGWFTSVKPFVNMKMNDWQSSIMRIVEEIKQFQESFVK